MTCTLIFNTFLNEKTYIICFDFSDRQIDTIEICILPQEQELFVYL